MVDDNPWVWPPLEMMDPSKEENEEIWVAKLLKFVATNGIDIDLCLSDRFAILTRCQFVVKFTRFSTETV
jgi:hypothetical protein